MLCLIYSRHRIFTNAPPQSHDNSQHTPTPSSKLMSAVLKQHPLTRESSLETASLSKMERGTGNGLWSLRS
ncbi:hypothetical protein V9T40_010304 [Parthenolecanium corni]|uniref:Uncharacterized protein n=1 Tax=Parthenolecanium corni TaxID=536013 RepID=A0AAN9T8N2_9HEMI